MAAAAARERFTGEVVRKRVSRGSKSERAAVVLRTESEELVLRRRQGNPFRDEALEELVGSRIACRGLRRGKSLIVDDWEIERSGE